MPKADGKDITTSRPSERAPSGGATASRRTLFGVAAMMALAIPARAIGDCQDAELIAVCAEFVAIEQRYRAIYDGPDAILDDDKAKAAGAPGHARQEVLLDRMHDLKATTPEGIQARAFALADHNRERAFTFEDPITKTGRLLEYLLRDARALGDSATAAIPSAGAAREWT